MNDHDFAHLDDGPEETADDMAEYDRDEQVDALREAWAEVDGINPSSPVREAQAAHLLDLLAERGWHLRSGDA